MCNILSVLIKNIGFRDGQKKRIPTMGVPHKKKNPFCVKQKLPEKKTSFPSEGRSYRASILVTLEGRPGNIW